MPADLRSLTDRERAIITKYRLQPQHGAVLAPVLTVPDSAGAIGFPLVALSPLARLEARGTISSGQRAAGEQFAALFQRAGLDPLRAADMTRTPISGGPASRAMPPGNEAARRRVGVLIDRLGGNGSPAASCAWHVIGLEWSIRRWALETCRGKDMACGVLVATLAVLEYSISMK